MQSLIDPFPARAYKQIDIIICWRIWAHKQQKYVSCNSKTLMKSIRFNFQMSQSCYAIGCIRIGVASKCSPKQKKTLQIRALNRNKIKRNGTPPNTRGCQQHFDTCHTYSCTRLCNNSKKSKNRIGVNGVLPVIIQQGEWKQRHLALIIGPVHACVLSMNHM